MGGSVCRSRWWAPRQPHHRPVVICHSSRFNITQCVALRSLACGRQLQTQETQVIIEPTDKQEPHLQHNINLLPRVVYIIFSSGFFHDCYECAQAGCFSHRMWLCPRDSADSSASGLVRTCLTYLYIHSCLSCLLLLHAYDSCAFCVVRELCIIIKWNEKREEECRQADSDRRTDGQTEIEK
jgi:hypothetical protein